MADLLRTPEELRKDQEAQVGQVERASGTPEPASAENLEMLPAEVFEVKAEMAPVPVEAPAEVAPQQDIAAVLEGDGSANVPAKAEKKEAMSREAGMLSAFVSGELKVLDDGEVAPAQVLKGLHPDTED